MTVKCLLPCSLCCLRKQISWYAAEVRTESETQIQLKKRGQAASVDVCLSPPATCEQQPPCRSSGKEEEVLRTYSRVSASFFWNSSSDSWLRRFLFRRLRRGNRQQQHIEQQRNKKNRPRWGRAHARLNRRRFSQPLQLLQVIESSSFHQADLVLHQVAANGNSTGRESSEEKKPKKTTKKWCVAGSRAVVFYLLSVVRFPFASEMDKT